MKTKIFRIRGKFMMGRKLQPFTKELKAIKKEDALEKIYSEFGSRHRASRNKIIIEEVTEISKEDIQDPEILALS